MQLFFRRTVPFFLLSLGLFPALWGCASAPAALSPGDAPAPSVQLMATREPEATPLPQATPTAQPVLKYVFLLIGDGMGPNQVSITNQALAAQGEQPLSFTDFPVQGELITNNVLGKTTDSAAAATAMATGTKTGNTILGQDPDGVRLTTVAETLRDRGMKIGVLTTVSLDHATPAGFYAHTEKRTNYEDITGCLFISGFDYFAGGGFHGDTDLTAPAKTNGYALTVGEAEADGAPAGKLISIGSSLKGDKGLQMAADAGVDGREGLLARNLRRGIDRLDGDSGFFIMTEGGRIDVACHYHDAGDMYREVLDFDRAVREAVAFYQAHPAETLLLVTADHETGDMQLTSGDPRVLAKQTVSCDLFDETSVPAFRAAKTPFETALPDIVSAFGLERLTAEETAYLKTAYRHTILDNLTGKELAEKYGSYEAVTSAAANLVAQRAGMAFLSDGHTGSNVTVYAMGPGAEQFSGIHENTFVHDGILAALDAYGAQ